MTEILNPIPESVQSETEEYRLRRLGRWAQRAYFGFFRGKRKFYDGEFDEVDTIPPGMARKFTQTINSHLQTGGEAVILEFPFPGRFRTRAHVITANSYLRQMNFEPKPLETYEWGNFSIRTGKPQGGAIKQGFQVDVRNDFGSELAYRIRWNDEELPRQRFAIILHDKGNSVLGWSRLLDFKLQGERDDSAWKINTSIYHSR